MNKFKVIALKKSKYYKNENDFKSKKQKKDYFDYDFWCGSDYILLKGNENKAVYIKHTNELIIYNNDCSLDEYKKELERFFSEPFDSIGFEELSTWQCDIEESSKRINNCKLGIKYRGGSGYYYGWWILINN